MWSTGTVLACAPCGMDPARTRRGGRIRTRVRRCAARCRLRTGLGITVAAADITPLDGPNYSAVPTEGEVAARQAGRVDVGRGMRRPSSTYTGGTAGKPAADGSRRLVIVQDASEVLTALDAARMCDVLRPGRALPAPRGQPVVLPLPSRPRRGP